MENFKEQSKYNSGPWTYDVEEHCLVDSNGNVIAEFYESDENGLLVAETINLVYFKENKPKN